MNINEDLKSAMRNKNKQHVTWLRQLKTECDAIAKLQKRDMNDEDIYLAASRFNKKIQQTKEYSDVTEEEAFIKTYLRSVLSTEDTEVIIKAYIANNENAKIGQVMGYLNKNHKNDLDMKIANQIVRRELS